MTLGKRLKSESRIAAYVAFALPGTSDKTVHLVLPSVAKLKFFASKGRLLEPSALPYGIYYATHIAEGQFVSNGRPKYLAFRRTHRVRNYDLFPLGGSSRSKERTAFLS